MWYFIIAITDMESNFQDRGDKIALDIHYV